MKDSRMVKLANILVNYSCAVKKGERILIEATGVPSEFTAELVKTAYAAGAIPLVQINDSAVQRAVMMSCGSEQLALMAKYDSLRMNDCQAYIGVRAGDNAFESSDVPAPQKALFAKEYSQLVHGKIRVPHTRWVVLRYPLPSMAQQAGMSTEAFEDFYFDVCTMDYGKMDNAMNALVKRMEATDRVRIVGNGSDLSFSIKGMPAIKCAGNMNIPDGEVFTAPLRESVNGVISYTAPSLYQGVRHENIRLTFENGKIVKSEGSRPDLLQKIFDTDPGARYVGEFAIGVNPFIHHAMLDTLFDEKIAGSFHFTPGMCYDECPNGNKSAIHWDLVCIQTPEFGGGEMWFDDTLIRRDGLFIPEDLHCLNPENLK